MILDFPASGTARNKLPSPKSPGLSVQQPTLTQAASQGERGSWISRSAASLGGQTSPVPDTESGNNHADCSVGGPTAGGPHAGSRRLGGWLPPPPGPELTEAQTREWRWRRRCLLPRGGEDVCVVGVPMGRGAGWTLTVPQTWVREAALGLPRRVSCQSSSWSRAPSPCCSPPAPHVALFPHF